MSRGHEEPFVADRPGAPVIRPMKARDAGRVAELSGQLGYPATAAQIARRFERIAARRDEQVLVAEPAGGGVVAGWIHVHGCATLESDPHAVVAGLVVGAEGHGRGIGKALLLAAESWAVDHGYPGMLVRSNVVREKARGFYEHMGYRVTKVQNNFRKTLDDTDA